MSFDLTYPYANEAAYIYVYQLCIAYVTHAVETIGASQCNAMHHRVGQANYGTFSAHSMWNSVDELKVEKTADYELFVKFTYHFQNGFN